MGFLSKFILCFLFINLPFFQSAANAGSIKVDRFASPIKLTNRILQPINVSIISQGK